MKYDYDYAISLFENAGNMRQEKFQRKLMNLLESDDFKNAMFRPNRADESASRKITELYSAACKSKVIDEIVETLDDRGYRNLDRSNACFFISLVNLGIEIMNTKTSDIADAKAKGKVNSREAEQVVRKMEKYQRSLNDLLKYAKKIVKVDAKTLSRESGIPRNICSIALYSSPDPVYVDRYKVGYYLNTLLATLYSVVDATGGAIDFEDVDWKPFFRGVFGKANLVEVATLILLEGVKRIDSYKSNAVHDCWDSLTTFALSELDKAPETIRDQMIELYLKRINKMLSNNGIDLRIDLRTIDNFKFSNLAKTVEQYADKISNLLDSAKGIRNAVASITATDDDDEDDD